MSEAHLHYHQTKLRVSKGFERSENPLEINRRFGDEEE